MSAQIYLQPGLEAAELIAHELEHILEQLDGVDLKTQAGNGAVWKSGDNAFETRRAIETGRRVAREVTGKDASGLRRRGDESMTDRVATAVQRDRDAAPFAARSARVSGSGRYVVFISSAQLVDTDRNQFRDVYVQDLATGLCTLESIGVRGAYLTCSEAPSCAADPPDKNDVADIYLRDTQTNTTRPVTHSFAGADPDGPSNDPAISGDGGHVVFVSEASNLTRDPIKRVAHIYVHDLATGITELVSRSPSGRPANGASLRPALSHDGARVAFQSLACNLICEGKCQSTQTDINLLWDVFVYDRSMRRLTRVSTDAGEARMENSRAPSLDEAGHVVAFGSLHPISERDDRHDEDL